MSDTNEIDVVIGEDASVTFIWTDALAALVPAGYTCDIARVSDVEPTADGRWTASMNKAIARFTAEQRRAYEATLNADQSRTLRMLGPFATRGEALAAEREWLRQYAGV